LAAARVAINAAEGYPTRLSKSSVYHPKTRCTKLIKKMEPRNCGQASKMGRENTKPMREEEGKRETCNMA
jgi:hypothetical protein